MHSKWMIVTAALTLGACGGGGGSSSGSGFLDDDSFESVEELETAGTPNFVISGFSATSVLPDDVDFTWRATVTNTGSGPGEIPDNGLLLESLTEDFSTGSTVSYHPVSRIDGIDSTVLQPGESAEVTGFNARRILVGFFGWTDSYVKFRLNPDYGTETFYNPEDGNGRFEPRYMQIEENYEDNTTRTVRVVRPVHSPRGLACFEDIQEENDTLSTAFPISLGVQYESQICEDSADVFQIDLVEGVAYDVIPEGFDFEFRQNFRLMVLDSSNNYVVDRIGVGGSFTAPSTDSFKIVITPPFGSDHSAHKGAFFTIFESAT